MKKISFCLLSMILVSTAIPVFAQSIPGSDLTPTVPLSELTNPTGTAASNACSTIAPDFTKPGNECGSICKYDIGTGKCANTSGSFDVSTSGDTTLKSTDLGAAQCMTLGGSYSVKSDENCKQNETKISCAADPNGYRCVSTDLFNTLDQNNLKSLGKKISPYVTKIEIPCNTKIAGGTCPKADNPAGYVARLYQFGLMIVGFVALGAMIYGAAKYTLSAGNFADKEDAKDQLLQAVYGIVLLLGAYLILYTINPSLVNLTNPTIEPINLDTLLPPDLNITESATGENGGNSPSENAGGMIDGCAVMSSGSAVDFGVGVSINGQNLGSASTGGGALRCTKCFDGFTLKGEICECAGTKLSATVCCTGNNTVVNLIGQPSACISCPEAVQGVANLEAVGDIKTRADFLKIYPSAEKDCNAVFKPK